MKPLNLFLQIILAVVFAFSLAGFVAEKWVEKAVYDKQQWQHTSDKIWHDSLWQKGVIHKVDTKLQDEKNLSELIRETLPEKQKFLAPYFAQMVHDEVIKEAPHAFDNKIALAKWQELNANMHKQMVMELSQNPDNVHDNERLQLDLRPLAVILLKDTPGQDLDERINSLPETYTQVHPLRSHIAAQGLSIAGYLHQYRAWFFWGLLISFFGSLLLNTVWLSGLIMIGVGMLGISIEKRIDDHFTGLSPTVTHRSAQIWWEDGRHSFFTDYIQELIMLGVYITIGGLIIWMARYLLRRGRRLRRRNSQIGTESSV